MPAGSYQVCLELVEVHIEGSVKPEAGCDGGDDLGNQPVQVGVGRSLHSQVVVAQIVNGLNTPSFRPGSNLKKGATQRLIPQ